MPDEVWTVKRILAWIEGYLAQHGDASSLVSARWLVSEALGVSRMQLYLDMDRPLTGEERAVLRDWTRRRAAGEPLQYITGEAAFRHITVKVAPGVLIPRPETEVLVSEALALLPAASKPQDAYDAELAAAYLRAAAEADEAGADASGAAGEAGEQADGQPGEPGVADPGGQRGEKADGKTPAMPGAAWQPGEPEGARELLVADICTGTGCIACSIASEHPRTRVVATDLSAEAAALARENVSALGLGGRVSVVECDLGEGVGPSWLGKLDLVVSNPPYVPTALLADMPREVASFEPALALDGGADGLAVFRRLLAWCARALRPGGAIAFELHEGSLDAAAAEARAAGYADVRIAHDLAGRPRILTARTRS